MVKSNSDDRKLLPTCSCPELVNSGQPVDGSAHRLAICTQRCCVVRVSGCLPLVASLELCRQEVSKKLLVQINEAFPLLFDRDNASVEPPTLVHHSVGISCRIGDSSSAAITPVTEDSFAI